jgi:hypothetical protein
MLFLKAVASDGQLEYFNTQNILSIRPLKNGYVKILMGAGMFWDVKPDTIELVELENIF